MALVACPQCGSQVSSDAEVCPQCGGRRRPADIVTAHATKSGSIVRWFGYSILALSHWSCSHFCTLVRSSERSADATEE